MINVKFTDDINDLVTENLYQWDTYQTLKISGINFDSITPRVHFANKKSKEALVVKAILKSDGTAEVSIPNSLLTEKYDILAYIYTNTGLTYKTIKSITIPVISRLKPSEYVQPSDEQIAEIEEIELQAKLILNRLYASEYNPSESYARPNIVYYNHSSYMCLSDVEISGVLPTDKSKWQLMAEGAIVTSLTKNSDGNLVFNFSNGTSFIIDITTKDVKLVDNDDIPAFNLTSEDVNYCKKLKIGAGVYKDAYGYFEPKTPGLYRITIYDYTEEDIIYSILMSIEEIKTKKFHSNVMKTSDGSDNIFYIKYDLVQTTTNVWAWRFELMCTSTDSLHIENVTLLLEY